MDNCSTYDSDKKNKNSISLVMHHLAYIGEEKNMIVVRIFFFLYIYVRTYIDDPDTIERKQKHIHVGDRENGEEKKRGKITLRTT